MTKIGIITHKNRKKIFWEFFDEVTDDDFLARFDVIFLEKKASNAIAIPKKVCFMSLWFKNRTQEVNFL